MLTRLCSPLPCAQGMSRCLHSDLRTYDSGVTAMSAADNAPELLRGLGRDDWRRMLDTAAAVGLLRRVEEGYYTVHPALPWFFHDLVREAFPDRLDTLERIFSEAYDVYGPHLFQVCQT